MNLSLKMHVLKSRQMHQKVAKGACASLLVLIYICHMHIRCGSFCDMHRILMPPVSACRVDRVQLSTGYSVGKSNIHV